MALPADQYGNWSYRIYKEISKGKSQEQGRGVLVLRTKEQAQTDANSIALTHGTECYATIKWYGHKTYAE